MGIIREIYDFAGQKTPRLAEFFDDIIDGGIKAAACKLLTKTFTSLVTSFANKITGGLATIGQKVKNKIEEMKNKIEKMIRKIEKIIDMVKKVIDASVKVIKSIVKLMTTYPICYVAIAVVLISAILIFFAILFGRFGSFQGEFTIDFDKMQEMNQDENEYTDLLNTGALKEAFYQSIADTSFYQTFNLTDLDGAEIDLGTQLIASLTGVITGQNITSQDILAQQKCTSSSSPSCIYSSGNILRAFSYVGITVPQLDSRNTVHDANMNPAKYLIQAESLGTYSDALGMTSYFRDYWNREESFKLDKDFLYELNRWMYETDKYPTTEQIVYPEAFVKPVSFVHDYLRIDTDTSSAGFGSPYVYVTQRVTMEDIKDPTSIYYGKYEYEGLIHSLPSDIVYDYVIADSNYYQIANQTNSSNQVNIGNASEYVSIPTTIDYGDGTSETTQSLMKLYWIVNPLAADYHMGVDITAKNATAFVDYSKVKNNQIATNYYYIDHNGQRQRIYATTDAFLGPFLYPSEEIVEGKKTIVFGAKLNEEWNNAGKLNNENASRVEGREYTYLQPNPDIGHGAFVVIGSTIHWVNCVIDYLPSCGGDNVIQPGEAIYYDGKYYYNATGSDQKLVENFDFSVLTRANHFVKIARVVDYEWAMMNGKRIYPGEILSLSWYYYNTFLGVDFNFFNDSTNKAVKADALHTTTISLNTTTFKIAEILPNVYYHFTGLFVWTGEGNPVLTPSFLWNEMNNNVFAQLNRGSFEEAKSIDDANLLPRKHYQLAQITDDSGQIIASSTNLINKTYLKTKTVRPYYRNSDDYWTKFEEFVTTDMDRAGYSPTSSMMGDCTLRDVENEAKKCYELGDKCALYYVQSGGTLQIEPDDWNSKKCSIVKYYGQQYLAADIVAKMSALFMGDNAGFAEMDAPAQALFNILLRFEDWLTETGTEGVEWEYKYYTHTKDQGEEAAAEFEPTWSFFGIVELPDPLGISQFFESDKKRYKKTFDTVVELNSDRAVASEYTPIAVVSGLNEVMTKYSCGNRLGISGMVCGYQFYYTTGDKPVVCPRCLKTLSGKDYTPITNNWGWRVDPNTGYLKRVYGETSLELPTYYSDKDVAEAAQNKTYKKIIQFYQEVKSAMGLPTFGKELSNKILNFMFNTDYGENIYGDVNFAYKWTKDVYGNYTLTYDGDALSDFYIGAFLNASNLPNLDGAGDDDTYQDIRNEDEAWNGYGPTYRPVEVAGNIGMMVSCRVDGRGCGRVTSKEDPTDYLAMELKSVRDYGLGSVLSYLEGRKVTFFTGLAITETYDEDGVYAWMYSYYCNTNQLDFLGAIEELKEASNLAKLATQGYYPSELLDVSTELVICPRCHVAFNSNGKCMNFLFCNQRQTTRTLSYFVKSTYLYPADSTDKTGKGAVGEEFEPSDLAAIADGLNSLQGTGQSIFKYINPHNNLHYWFTVTYATGVDDTNTDQNDMLKESQGYVLMMKKIDDVNKDGVIDQKDERDAVWQQTNVNMVIPYLTEEGIASSWLTDFLEDLNFTAINLKSDYVADGKCPQCTRKLILGICSHCGLKWLNAYTDEVAREEANNQFFNPMAYYLAWYDFSTGNLDLGDKLLTIITREELISKYDNNTAEALRRIFNVESSCINCECTDTQAHNNNCTCAKPIDNLPKKFSNGPDGKCDKCGYPRVAQWTPDALESPKLCNCFGFVDQQGSVVSMGDGVCDLCKKVIAPCNNPVDLNNDNKCDNCKGNLCTCDCHSVFISLEEVSNIKTKWWTSTKFLEWIANTFDIGDLFKGAGKHTTESVYQHLYETYYDSVFQIDLLDSSRTSRVYMIEEAVTFLGNFVYTYDTQLLLAGDIYGNQKLVSDLVFADRGYVISNYIFQVPSYTTQVMWSDTMYDEVREIIFDGNYSNAYNQIYANNPCNTRSNEKDDMSKVEQIWDSTWNAIQKGWAWFVGDVLKAVDKEDLMPDEVLDDPENNYCAANYTYKEHVKYKYTQTYIYAEEPVVVSNRTSCNPGDTSNGGKTTGTKTTCQAYTVTTRPGFQESIFGEDDWNQPPHLMPEKPNLGGGTTVTKTYYTMTTVNYVVGTRTYTDQPKWSSSQIKNNAWEGDIYIQKTVEQVDSAVSKIEYRWHYAWGHTYKINKLNYENSIYIDTYNEVTRVYHDLVANGKSSTAAKIFIGMYVLADQDDFGFFGLDKNSVDMNFTHLYTATTYKLCPNCGEMNLPTATSCARQSCGKNLLFVAKTEDAVLDNRKLVADEEAYTKWCSKQGTTTKCMAAAYGDTNQHYGPYSYAYLDDFDGDGWLTNIMYAIQSFASNFSNQMNLEKNLRNRYGLLLGTNRVNSNGTIKAKTWWLKDSTVQYDEYGNPLYNIYQDTLGNLDDFSITVSGDMVQITDQTFTLSKEDLQNIADSIQRVFSDNYRGSSWAALGDAIDEDSSTNPVILKRHKDDIANSFDWNTEIRGTRAYHPYELAASDPSIQVIDNDCLVNFYWKAKSGATGVSTSVYYRTVKMEHHISADWRVILVGVDAGNLSTYGTPIALETTMYGSYKQITPVETGSYFNEEVYTSWSNRISSSNGSKAKEDYLLSYKSATTSYLYDYLMNFETYIPLGVLSDADLVNRGKDAYTSIQANDQRAYKYTSTYMNQIKKYLESDGWINVIDNYNFKTPVLDAIISAIIPSTTSNDVDASLMAEYIAGLIETAVEYAPMWTIDYYNSIIEEQNKAIDIANAANPAAPVPHNALIERSYENYSRIEDQLFMSLMTTSTSNLDCRKVKLAMEDGTTKEYDMLYLGYGVISAINPRTSQTIKSSAVGNSSIRGFSDVELNISYYSDDRLNMEKSLKYVCTKFGKLLHKYGNVASATMAYFYGELYWDAMLVTAVNEGISTGPEWHNDDVELIASAVERIRDKIVTSDNGRFVLLDRLLVVDDELLPQIVTAQVVDYNLSFVSDPSDRLFLIRNNTNSLGKDAASIGSKAKDTHDFYEQIKDSPLEIYVGHKYTDTIAFSIDYTDIDDIARKMNVDLGVLMAIMMAESDGNPCYGLGTCRAADGAWILTSLTQNNKANYAAGLFGIYDGAAISSDTSGMDYQINCNSGDITTESGKSNIKSTWDGSSGKCRIVASSSLTLIPSNVIGQVENKGNMSSINIEKIHQNAQKDDKAYAQFDNLVDALQNKFVANDGRYTSNGRDALIYTIIKLKNIYAETGSDALDAIYVYYYGETQYYNDGRVKQPAIQNGMEKLANLKTRANNMGYGNDWYAYYLDYESLLNFNDKVKRTLEYYDASLSDQSVFQHIAPSKDLGEFEQDHTGEIDIIREFNSEVGTTIEKTTTKECLVNEVNGKWRCSATTVTTIKYDTKWELTINGFSINSFLLFGDTSAYNSYSSNKLGMQNNGIEVFEKPSGGTRLDVDTIITATYAKEDSFMLSANEYSLFSFFAEKDKPTTENDRSWFNVSGVNIKDGIGVGTTNNVTKNAVSDFPILFKPASPTGSMNIEISEHFGEEPDLINGGFKDNVGIKITASRGSSVKAIAGGLVTNVGYNTIFGNFVEVQNNNPNIIISTVEGQRYQITGIRVIYGHLLGNEYGGNMIASGSTVSSGTTIGKVGVSGNTTGDQVYIALYISYNALDDSDQVIESSGWLPVDVEKYFTTEYTSDNFYVTYE